MVKIDDLEAKIEKLKTNREKVPIEILKTKYKKGYDALLEDIRQQAQEAAVLIATSGCRFLKSDYEEEKEAFIQRASEIISKERDEGTWKEYSRAIFKEYDMWKAFDIASAVNDKIFQEAYRPYWEKHCSIDPEGTITNDIIDMEWDGKTNTWINYKSGTLSFMVMLPPPEEWR